MNLEKANLISWCRHLAQAGNLFELVDERPKEVYTKDQASLCMNLALACLQKMPELRLDIEYFVYILKGEVDLPSVLYFKSVNLWFCKCNYEIVNDEPLESG
ncbi:unnamed protein product, partial [Ilex paraguariensis]